MANKKTKKEEYKSDKKITFTLRMTPEISRMAKIYAAVNSCKLNPLFLKIIEDFLKKNKKDIAY